MAEPTKETTMLDPRANAEEQGFVIDAARNVEGERAPSGDDAGSGCRTRFVDPGPEGAEELRRILARQGDWRPGRMRGA